MSASRIISASLSSFYQNWWKFDEVLTKQFCAVFWRHAVNTALPRSPNSIICYRQKLEDKDELYVVYWFCDYGLAATAVAC